MSDFKELRFDNSLTFRDGGVIHQANQSCEGYMWSGGFPKVIPPESDMLSTGGLGHGRWVDLIYGGRIL